MINTNEIKKFAREARTRMIKLVTDKLHYVITSDSAELRVKERQINKLKEEIAKLGKNEVIEKVAYTWFNRFMALRFMDVNGYTNFKVVTPANNDLFPEIFKEAKAGKFNDEMIIDKERFFNIIDRKITLQNPENEAYKMLLIAECNRWHRQMPFVFEAVEDYSELLLPEDLFSDSSIVAYIKNGMKDEDCQYEELIGWIYQFYISEKKDNVFADLAKNKKITAENIPAATQLFTPNWIVKYLVENTLGKLWLEQTPDSNLKEKMKYYIESEITPRKDNIPITSVKFIDPCCGSGHILVYAFDLFAMIYEELGYNQNEIPRLILENNIFGIDIDDRAAQLTHFALTMKARRYYSRYFKNPLEPNVIALQNYDNELFSQAKNFGSLIRISSEQLEKLNVDENTIFEANQQEIKRQAEYLSNQYNCVVTNPPYMGGKGMNADIKKFVEKEYKDSKSDLMTCFMTRCLDFTINSGYFSMINLPSWMFLSSFEDLRNSLVKNNYILSLLHFGRGIFGIDFGSVAFSIKKEQSLDRKGQYYRLHKRNFQHIYYYHIEKIFLNAKNDTSYKFDFDSYRDEDGVTDIPNQSYENGLNIYYNNVNQSSFSKIPGSPIAYWASEKYLKIFEFNNLLSKNDIKSATGLQTGDNNQFIRNWYEVSFNLKNAVWYPINNGGESRKWYGNFISWINWENDGYKIKSHKSSVIRNSNFYFKEGGTWNRISSSFFSVRYLPVGFIFDQSGDSFFTTENKDIYSALAFLNSKVGYEITKLICPTLNTTAGNFDSFPIPSLVMYLKNKITKVVGNLITISKTDWDTHEKSWDFQQLRIVNHDLRKSGKLDDIYELWRKEVSKDFMTLHYNEEELNRIFIDIYGLKDELTPEVELKDVTILQQELLRDKLSEVNAKIKHITNEDTELTEEDKNRIIEENTKLLTSEYFDWSEIVQQLISYAVGCMMGRYSLDKEGVILANQGETLEDYLKQVPNPRFVVDSDGIIPILDEEFFEDDIVGRFREFIRTAFGDEYFEENIKFIEKALGKDIRKYFVKDFYNDHVKRYKKRPIYWLFSSPKKNFNALIYMHRYTPDMISVLLNNYMREYKAKLENKKQSQINIKISPSTTATDKNKAEREIIRIDGILKELKDYEETLYDAAMRKTNIDLDDGVKVNYMKFKDIIYPIKGLEKEE